jgi:hypothetical protein
MCLASILDSLGSAILACDGLLVRASDGHPAEQPAQRPHATEVTRDDVAIGASLFVVPFRFPPTVRGHKAVPR